MMIDILARICFLGKSFWQDWWNIADVCVGGLCMALMIDFLVYHGALDSPALYQLRGWRAQILCWKVLKRSVQL